MAGRNITLGVSKSFTIRPRVRTI